MKSAELLGGMAYFGSSEVAYLLSDSQAKVFVAHQRFDTPIVDDEPRILRFLRAELEADGYTATRHQQEVGTGYFDLVADAIRAGTGADIALINGGSLRGDRIYPRRSAISRGDVRAELPDLH